MEAFASLLGGKDKKKSKTKKRANCYAGRTKKNGRTCFADKSLITLRDMWNKQHPDRKITSRKSYDIWDKLNVYLAQVCENEICWLEQKFSKGDIAKRLKKIHFAPMQPVKWKKNKNEWLNSLDITNVMKQYEHDYKDFQFLGPSPIDFDLVKDNKCIEEEICKCNVCDKYNEGINKIGFIFNLDPHYKGGSHWVSLFVNLDENYIFFLDSNGIKIPKEIKQLVNRMQKQAKEGLHKKLRFIDNAPMEHQHENTECGMYSLYNIISLLTKQKTPRQIKNKRIPDADMEEFRSIFFNA